MGVRSALAGTLTRAAKALGTDVEPLAGPGPEAMHEAALDVSQMGPDHPFSPGEPVGPYDGYSRTPRILDYTTSYNVATRPRTHERVSFDALKGLIGAYDVADICIWHRIDSIRSLKWQLISSDGYIGDVTGAIALAQKVLKKPDGKQSFKAWLAKYVYDILAYDAGTLYRMRNRAGQCVGLKPVDGTLIAPLLDYWGDSPDPPAEAYVQYVNGLPWGWLTRDDLIYEPFRPHSDSPYGHAPIESIMLNANTDIRFQIYFLQRFTEGNIPEAFASAPENWNPEQIEVFQSYWDEMIYGDQKAKHQIRWLPGGSSFTWSNEKDFTDTFSLFLMRKTCASFHVVPSDLGFTEDVNRSSGESQADVQHRVGDLPLMEHIEGILTAFLTDDLGLPLQFEFDRGEEQDDQLNVAQSDQIYIQNGVVGASEIREMRFGLAEPEGQAVPRVFFTERGGPIPLSALYGVAGKIDPQTSAPDPDTPLPHMAFTGVPGVLPNPPLVTEPLAEQEYGPKALPPAGPAQPGTVAKEDGGAGSGTTGITSETGITSYDLDGREDDDDEQAVAKELAAFRRFEKARRKGGRWRDFEFEHVPAGEARRLNGQAREQIAKADDAGPKWPGWRLADTAAAYWSPLILAAIAGALTPALLSRLAVAYLAAFPGQQGDAPGKQDRNAAAYAWLTAWLAAAGVSLDLGTQAAGILADGYLIGTASAAAMVNGTPAELGGWQPGDSAAAESRVAALGGGAALGAMPSGQAGSAAITGVFIYALARALAGTSGDKAALAADLAGVTADADLTANATLDQLYSAAGSAAMDWYSGRYTGNYAWLTDPTLQNCPTCLGNEAGDPRPLGEPWPSGDTDVSIHFKCGCALVPA